MITGPCFVRPHVNHLTPKQYLLSKLLKVVVFRACIYSLLAVLVEILKKEIVVSTPFQGKNKAQSFEHLIGVGYFCYLLTP